jgi:hypothetical protein
MTVVYVTKALSVVNGTCLQERLLTRHVVSLRHISYLAIRALKQAGSMFYLLMPGIYIPLHRR